MNFLKLAALGAIVTILAGCNEHQSMTVGGVPAVFIKKPPSTTKKHVVSKFDPTYIETPRTRGQLKFGLPIEKNFTPSPEPERELPKRKSVADSVPEAIEEFRRGR